MNLGIIAKPNSKGQIVIPKKYRDELGIENETLLNLVLRGGVLQVIPLERTRYSRDSRKIQIEILKRTAGAWANENWKKYDKLEKERKKKELKKIEYLRKAW